MIEPPVHVAHRFSQGGAQKFLRRRGLVLTLGNAAHPKPAPRGDAGRVAHAPLAQVLRQQTLRTRLDTQVAIGRPCRTLQAPTI